MWIQFEQNDRNQDRISFVIMYFISLLGFLSQISSAEFLRITKKSIPVESSKFTGMDDMKKKQQQQGERIE